MLPITVVTRDTYVGHPVWTLHWSTGT